jgi:hypothetical protein
MLEPIEESDLDLKTKFLKGGAPKTEELVEATALKNDTDIKLAPEETPTPEIIERKEGRM